MTLMLMQWNCRGIYRKISELKNWLENMATKPDVIALQETHLISKYTPRIRGYVLLRKDRDIHGGGVCFFINERINFQEIQMEDAHLIESQLIMIDSLKVFNLYIPPNKSISKDLLFRTFRHCASKCVIVGDFNAHHSLWGSRATNSCGRHLFHVIDTLNLVVHNTHIPTRVHLSLPNPGASSVLDLTLSSYDCSHKITTTVTDHLLGSDHFIVLSGIGFQPNRADRHLKSWSFQRANRQKFRDLCSQNFNSLADSAKHSIERITDCVIDAAEKSIPLSRHCVKSSVSWWDKACA